MNSLIDVPPIIEHPITLGLFFMLAGYLYYLLLLNIKHLRQIQDTPRSKIHAAAQGYVELHGKAKSLFPRGITSPVSGRQCLWYEYDIYEPKRYSSGSGGEKLRCCTSESKGQNFLISDETGDCLVDIYGAKIYGEKTSWRISGAELPGQIQEKVSSSKSQVLVNETIIREGDPVVAAGVFQTTGTIGKPMNLTEEYRELMMAWFKDKDKALELWDENRNGKLDANEIKKLHQDSWAETLKHFHKNKGDYTIHTLAATGEKSRPFVISFGEELNLEKELMHHRVGLIFGNIYFGGGFIILAVIKLINFLHSLGYI